MENGDSLACSNWYKELLILPWPDSANKFMVISSMATSGQKYLILKLIFPIITVWEKCLKRIHLLIPVTLPMA
jgi:hypothetical protein